MAWLGKVISSFGCAIAGVMWLVKTQRNAQIHVVAAFVVTVLGLWLGINRIEWCMIVVVAGLVVAAEALNTAVEHLADRITTQTDEHIRRAKDVAAGAVLVAAMAAVVVGLLVFVPHLLAKMN